ncbi:MAG: LexA family transcriptional regulator [Clostridia bacterium]|nr:LexA family transcriptional regulator [Clostridia bacterium]
MSRANSDGMTNEAGIAYGELIRRQRRSKKMSQEELGALVSVGKNAVGAWEAGRSRPDVGSVPVICRALDLSLDEFFGLQETARIDPGNQLETNEASELIRRYAALNPYNRQVVMREMEMLYDMQGSMKKPPRRVIRLYQNDMAASAGPGETLEAARGEEVYVYADPVTETADEIIRVNGNSMEPTYCDGDLVFVRHAASLQEGEIGIFVTGDTGYIKEYHRDGLYSHNPAYQPIIFSEGTEVRCIGRVIGKVSQDDWADDESIEKWKTANRKGR